jgi:hypothetical protein
MVRSVIWFAVVSEDLVVPAIYRRMGERFGRILEFFVEFFKEERTSGVR